MSINHSQVDSVFHDKEALYLNSGRIWAIRQKYFIFSGPVTTKNTVYITLENIKKAVKTKMKRLNATLRM